MTQDDWLADPQYREAVVDLLGALAYGELTAFTRLAGDSELAPTQPLKAAVAGLAVAEFRHYEILVRAPGGDGRRPRERDGPVRRGPRRLPRAHPAEHLARGPGQGLRRRRDRHRLLPRDLRVRGPLDPGARPLDAMQDVGQAEFVVKVVREAIKADERVAGRLALWGRRLVGEALSQAQQVAVERDALSSLLVGGVGGPEPAQCRPRRARAGCSPGSPTSTPAGWAASAWPPRARPVCRRLARTAGTPSGGPSGALGRTTRWACAGHAKGRRPVDGALRVV